VLHRDCNNYSKVTNLFSNLFRICKRQEFAFVYKNDLLYIRALNYIKIIEKITLIKQINASKIAIIE